MAHTYSILPQNIPAIITNIVSEVSSNLSAEIGSTIAFKHGTWASIKKRIVEEASGTVTKDARFPLICLVQVFEEKYRADSEYGEVTLTLLICAQSDPNWYAEERYTNNYIPTLYPIYAEFMAVLMASPYFMGYRELYPEHTKADDLHLPETDVNKLPECLDGLWIRDLKLRVDPKCADVGIWLNTEIQFGTPTVIPGLPTGTQEYPFKLIVTTGGVQVGTTFEVTLTAGQTLSVIEPSPRFSVSQVGNVATITVDNLTGFNGTIALSATCSDALVVGLVTGVVTGASNLVTGWILHNNKSDSVTL